MNYLSSSKLTWILLVSALSMLGQSSVYGQASTEEVRPGYLVRVPLPINDETAPVVKQKIQQVLEQATTLGAAKQRPVLVLEFDTSNDATGQGSELGNCLDLAVMLSEKKLQALYTVAYIPRSKTAAGEDGQPASQLKGHALLVALACNEIAMHDDSALGEAGLDVQSNNPSLELSTYQNIIDRRSKYPIAWVNALVDKNLSLYRITDSDGNIGFVDAKGLSEKQVAGNIVESTTLNTPGTLPLFSSQELLKQRLILNRVASRIDLATRFDLDQQVMDQNIDADSERIAAVLPINRFIDDQEADWTLRMLNNHLAAQPETNLLVVRIDTLGGDLDASMRIARELASFDPDDLYTVAWVESPATGPSSLVALACDQIVMSQSAALGGDGSNSLSVEQIQDAKPLIQRFAADKEMDWSLPLGLIDTTLSISRYRNTRSGQFRLLSEEEYLSLPKPELWNRVETIELNEGLSSLEAGRLGLSKGIVESFDQLKSDFQLVNEPTQLQPSPTDRWVRNLARELASPWVAAWLLFGAIFLLSTEMSNPGIGIPGFLGTICLMLFFWSQYLDGNANWLEILLFVVGVVFVVLEVFVIPGFGVFGIGGLLMIVAGIVLASQTFIIPRNSEELARLPVSLSMVLAAGGGFMAGIFFIRKYLTTMPVFRRIMLQPPTADESISPAQRELKESLVDRTHLMGKSGQAVTPLVPAGKAQIGNELIDVITDGRLIERGQVIRVIEVTGNRVLVDCDDKSA